MPEIKCYVPEEPVACYVCQETFSLGWCCYRDDDGEYKPPYGEAYAHLCSSACQVEYFAILKEEGRLPKRNPEGAS